MQVPVLPGRLLSGELFKIDLAVQDIILFSHKSTVYKLHIHNVDI